MKPVDFSRQSFAELKATLDLRREEVWRAWLAHGPGTTREVAARAGQDILSFRPRSTELYQLGLLALVDKDGHNGVYRARTLADWEHFVTAQKLPANSQLSLTV